MPVKGQAGRKVSLSVSTSVEVKPVELSFSQSGKIGINLSVIKMRLSQIRMAFLFLPLPSLGAWEVSTEPARLEVNLSEIAIQTPQEKVTKMQVITSGEISANTSLEGDATRSGRTA
jgi:hypothetical protein